MIAPRPAAPAPRPVGGADAAEIVVGMAEMRVSATPGASLVTYALGSCLGVAVHDADAGVAGLLHVMLPWSAIDPERAAANPHLFVDTGVPALLRACYRLGARKERMVVRVAGGAFSGAEPAADLFRIGARNLATLRALLARSGVALRGEAVGGANVPRTLRLDVSSGRATLTVGGARRAL